MTPAPWNRPLTLISLMVPALRNHSCARVDLGLGALPPCLNDSTRRLHPPCRSPGAVRRSRRLLGDVRHRCDQPVDAIQPVRWLQESWLRCGAEDDGSVEIDILSRRPLHVGASPPVVHAPLESHPHFPCVCLHFNILRTIHGVSGDCMTSVLSLGRALPLTTKRIARAQVELASWLAAPRLPPACENGRHGVTSRDTNYFPSPRSTRRPWQQSY